ncbi:hypothetical protein L6R52_33395, partial [Myxococcota bacterium]|nr:hypothetical protein [Myxococcota bacterium]
EARARPERVEPAEPEVEPAPRVVRERKPREVAPATEDVRPRTRATDELRALLRRAEQDPALVSELARGIDRAAEGIGDERARVRVRRIAASSALVGDLAGLARALDLLDEALR